METANTSNINKVLAVSGWGYSMTLNNFYKVISETSKTAIVREIGSKCIENTGYMSGYEVPNEESEGSKEFRVIKNSDGTFKGKLDFSRTHTLKEVTVGQKFYFNHCD